MLIICLSAREAPYGCSGIRGQRKALYTPAERRPAGALGVRTHALRICESRLIGSQGVPRLTQTAYVIGRWDITRLRGDVCRDEHHGRTDVSGEEGELGGLVGETKINA